MKSFWTILFLMLLCGCGANNITEVGNPSTSSVTSGTATALTLTANRLILSLSGLVDNSDSSGFECTFDEATGIEACTCPGGGSIVHRGKETDTQNGSVISFNISLESSFQNCGVAACGETSTLDGDFSGMISGDLNVDTEAGNVTFQFTTASPCAGITANGLPLGFDVTDLFDGTNGTLSGSLCVDNNLITFSSLDELGKIVDPDQTCAGGF